MSLFDKMFRAHPQALGESYLQHQRFAFSFAKTLFSAGAAAAVHGLVPGLFETTASEAVSQLHGRMFRRAQDARRDAGP